MDLRWLIDLFQARDETGEFLYSRLQIEDFIATVLLSIGFDPKTTPPVLIAIIEAFALRAGVEQGEDRAVSEEKIKNYLQTNPLHPALSLAFQQQLRQSFARNDTGALERAFARFADEDLSKRAPDRKRTEGTRPAYLALLAHEDID